MKYKCQDCGLSHHRDRAGADPYPCDCGGTMIVQAVPKEDLEALVEEWREDAWNEGSTLYAEGKSECADELEEFINNE